jgi:hypothetical protein
MGIGIYTSVDPDKVLSQNGDFLYPFSITFDGRVGGYRETKLFIRNDDSDYYYNDLTLSLLDENPESIINNGGYVWKLYYGDQKPTFNDWLNIPAATSIQIEDLGSEGNSDISTYLPFWVFIQVPNNIDVQVFTKTKFVVSGNEILA